MKYKYNSNSEYLKDNGFELGKYPALDNFALNTKFKEDSLDSIFVGEQEIARKDYLKAFSEKIWKALTLQQKIQVLSWVKLDILASSGIVPKKFIYLKKDEPIYDGWAALTYFDEIMLNLEVLDKNPGYYILSVVAHECVHVKDYHRTEEILNKLKQNYLKISSYDEIMSLPVAGKIYNFTKNEYENISNDLQKDILLLKNMISHINYKDSYGKRRKQVTNYESYKRYLNYIYYLNAPLEKHAFKEELKYFLTALKKNKHLNDDKELENAYNIYKALLQQTTKSLEIKKHFNVSEAELINMVLIREYNRTNRKKLKRKFDICPELMEKLAEVEERYWKLKFQCKAGDDRSEEERNEGKNL